MIILVRISVNYSIKNNDEVIEENGLSGILNNNGIFYKDSLSNVSFCDNLFIRKYSEYMIKFDFNSCLFSYISNDTSYSMEFSLIKYLRDSNKYDIIYEIDGNRFKFLLFYEVIEWLIS